MTDSIHFSNVKETDNTITVGSASFDQLHRNRLDYDRLKLIEQSLKAYRLNPLARRIVKVYRYFALGSNVTIEIKAKPENFIKRAISQDRLNRTRKFIHDFWHHPINKLDDQIPEWFDERSLTGDLFLLFSVDASGMPLVRAVPAETITKIDTRSNDYRQETTYHTGEIDDKAWPAYDPLALDGADSITPFMRHYVINRPVGCNFGESDLFPVLPWIARHTGWLENRASLNYYRSLFVWVLTGTYPSEADRLARQNQLDMNPPTPNSILVKNASETWEALAPKLDAADANEDGLALKKEIALGVGIPLHYLSEPEGSTRTTAEAAGTPTFRNLQDYQQSFFNAIKDVLLISCNIYSKVKNLMTDFEIDIHGQEISERDNATLALAFARAVPQVAEMYDRHMIDTAEFLRLAYSFAGEVYDEEPTKEGLRRPLSAKSSGAPSGNAPSTPPNAKDPKNEPDPTADPTLPD
jgi:hypothetical protein